MPFRKRTSGSKKLEAARQSAPPDYPAPLPTLRRRIVITDYDFGEVTHVIELYRSDRIDCYKAFADGQPWKARIGWAKVLEAIRKSFIRVGAQD